jgi:DNA-directed RNA polymerase specialized sigma24 family protein
MAMSDTDSVDSDPGSVTCWLMKMQSGDHEAAARIWALYYDRLVQFAERRLLHNADYATDSEDLVHSAFRRFCLAAMSGRYREIEGRRELWDLLITCTLNRIRKHLRSQRTQKRTPPGERSSGQFEAEILEDLRRPDAGAIMADLLQCWLLRLGEEDPTGELRQIAVMRMEQLSAESISRSLRRSKTLILAKIRLIELIWERCEQL